MIDLRHIEPQGHPGLPRSFLPAGRAVRQLRAQIEAATGASVGFRSLGRPAVWSTSPMREGRAILHVNPGPLLSPYDSPANGLSSLRLSYAGRPVGGEPVSPDLGDLLRARRLSGFNRFDLTAGPTLEDAFARPSKPDLALIDPHLAAAPRALRAFLTRLLTENPGRTFVAAGPDGCPRDAAPVDTRITTVTTPADPWRLYPLASRIHVADWGAGCEAALAGFEPLCAMPDVGPRPESEAAFLALRFGAGIHGFDPWTRRPVALAEAAERVAWLRDRFLGNARRVVLVGVSGWKRSALNVFATGPDGPPLHTMTSEEAVALARTHRGRVQAWATRCPEQLPRLCAEAGLPFARIEDGFLRSVGLGASLQPGASVVVDDLGIYYDPRAESRLARILKETEFAPGLTGRAAALREAIVARRLSKYNVGLGGAREDWPTDRRIVLVPGQVEDDASVLTGSPQVRGNLALLRAARARHPDAFLLYKPHPDVEAGFRPGAIPAAELAALADRVVGGLSIVDLLDRCHHVETMTSLAGFEALIRGLSVSVHGRPFYAGWGLTEDLAPGAGRGRKLELDELVAGALILYPLYLDPVAMKPCTPEQLLDRLSEARAAAPRSPFALGALRHRTMRLRYAVLNPILKRLRARRGVRTGAER